MTKPRPNTHMERLHDQLLRLAAAGEELPPLPVVAEQLGVANVYLYGLLDRGQRAGLWRLARAEDRITAIHGPRGGWLVHCRFRRYRAEADRPARKCLRCREEFQPAHRTKFMCEGCCAFAAQAML